MIEMSVLTFSSSLWLDSKRMMFREILGGTKNGFFKSEGAIPRDIMPLPCYKLIDILNKCFFKAQVIIYIVYLRATMMTTSDQTV